MRNIHFYQKGTCHIEKVEIYVFVDAILLRGVGARSLKENVMGDTKFP